MAVVKQAAAVAVVVLVVAVTAAVVLAVVLAVEAAMKAVVERWRTHRGMLLCYLVLQRLRPILALRYGRRLELLTLAPHGPRQTEGLPKSSYSIVHTSNEEPTREEQTHKPGDPNSLISQTLTPGRRSTTLSIDRLFPLFPFPRFLTLSSPTCSSPRDDPLISLKYNIVNQPRLAETHRNRGEIARTTPQAAGHR